jgi:hypothetical protein
MKARTAPVLVVAGGNHVTVLVDATETDGSFDVIEVPARRRSPGPPARVRRVIARAGGRAPDLQGARRSDCADKAPRLLREGDSATVEPWEWHAALNESDRPVRFVVVGRPGPMTGYFEEAGVAVAHERTAPDREPPGPAALTEIAARYGIRFWGGA